ncbi:hypothetical protein GGR58DRAFT_409446 [Xylaria digitata]|nr:hypothetical protein GGR58DRAFT_409446 [Xylaria digitata]
MEDLSLVERILNGRRIYEAIQRIPSGKVSSYKDVAASCGATGGVLGVHDVLRAIRDLPESLDEEFNTSNVRWYRVVLAKGVIPRTFPRGADAQQMIRELNKEGHHISISPLGKNWIGGGFSKWYIEGEDAGSAETAQARARELLQARAREQARERKRKREPRRKRARKQTED